MPTNLASKFEQHPLWESVVKSFSSREFNQDVSKAKRFANYEPVFVTDRGTPTHVLLSVEAYRQLVGKSDTLADLLATGEHIAAEPDWRAAGPWYRKG